MASEEERAELKFPHDIQLGPLNFIYLPGFITFILKYMCDYLKLAAYFIA